MSHYCTWLGVTRAISRGSNVEHLCQVVADHWIAEREKYRCAFMKETVYCGYRSALPDP
jgi:hypothetical protein